MTPTETALALLQPLEAAGKLSVGSAAELASWVDDRDPAEGWSGVRSHLAGMVMLDEHGRPLPADLPAPGPGFDLVELPETLPMPEPPADLFNNIKEVEPPAPDVTLPSPPTDDWRAWLFAKPNASRKDFTR